MSRCFVIAEAGVNHNGSLHMAKDLIRSARICGANAVKFQSFKSASLATASAPKAKYQAKHTTASQLEMLKGLELSAKDFRELREYADSQKIEMFSTPFDLESLRELVSEVGVRRLKVASGELTNGPLLLEMARTQMPIIISTGMSTLDEIQWALSVVAFGIFEKSGTPTRRQLEEIWKSREPRQVLAQRIVLLQCTSQYPAPASAAHLRTMNELGRTFRVPFGFSDHTLGILAPVAAVARGARAVEKHLTLNRGLPGPDHEASLEPAQFSQMVLDIREVETLLGKKEKAVSGVEADTRAVARKSLVALRPIKKGERLTNQNMGLKRPGTGISATEYWDFIGQTTDRDYQADDLIQREGE